MREGCLQRGGPVVLRQCVVVVVVVVVVIVVVAARIAVKWKMS